MKNYKLDEPRNSKNRFNSKPLSANSSGIIDPIENDDYSLRGLQNEGKNK